MFPVAFELNRKAQKKLYRNVFDALLSRELVSVGDLVIFTKGDLDGVSGSTNSMTIIEVTKPE